MTNEEKKEILNAEFHKVSEEVDWEKIENARIFVLTRTKRALCDALERLDQELDKKMKATWKKEEFGIELDLEKAINEIGTEWDCTNHINDCGETIAVMSGVIDVELDGAPEQAAILLEMKDGEEPDSSDIYSPERVVSINLI